MKRFAGFRAFKAKVEGAGGGGGGGELAATDAAGSQPTHVCVALGNFDGVHLGHQKILTVLKAQALRHQCEAMVYTFRPHPQAVLRPATAPDLILTYDEKAQVLQSLGVDGLIEEPFDAQFASLSAEEFFRQVLVEALGTLGVVVGYNFSFGKKRSGTLPQLAQWCEAAGIAFEVVTPQTALPREGPEGAEAQLPVLSSSKVREYLLRGEVSAAHKLLGRPFFYQGKVVHGAGRGSKIGFPTANLSWAPKILLPHGVYATWSHWQGKVFPSISHLGVRPTFAQTAQGEKGAGEGKAEQAAAANPSNTVSDAALGQGALALETHFLGGPEDDGQGKGQVESPAAGGRLLEGDFGSHDALPLRLDLYGVTLRIDFCEYLRPEIKFAGVGELQKQIELDIARAKISLHLSRLLQSGA